MAVFIGLNLRGVGEAGGVEVFLVWFKLVVLVALATWGLAHWQPSMLWRGVPEPGLGVAMYGAATVFMAYEGFQLLTYDYDDIERPERTLSRAVLIAIPVVIAVYVLVALGTAMLIGADEIVRNEEVALAVAGERAAGVTGLVIVTIGAAFSTGSAINSTLFATARLAHEVARNGQLPAVIDHRNRAGVPDRAVVGLGAAAAVLAGLGSLTLLVEAASLAFLLTFAVVCGVAFYERAGARVVTGLGALGATACAVTLMVRMIRLEPLALLILGLLVAVATIGRPWILRHVTTNTSDSARPTPSRPATALSRVSSAVQPPQGSNCPEPGASPSSNSGI
jgi:hypothetical protein